MPRNGPLFAGLATLCGSISCTSLPPEPVTPQSGEMRIVALHAPPHVTVNTPFTVYVDLDDPCGDKNKEEIQVTPGSSLSNTLSVIQTTVIALSPGQVLVCPAVVALARMTTAMTFQTVGEASIEFLPRGARLKERKTLQVVPQGPVVPSWSPPPLL